MQDDEIVEQMTRFLKKKGWLGEKGEAQHSTGEGWYVDVDDFKPKLKYWVTGQGCDGYGCRPVVWVDEDLVAEFWAWKEEIEDE